jgi:predicted transcriptional regulator
MPNRSFIRKVFDILKIISASGAFGILRSRVSLKANMPNRHANDLIKFCLENEWVKHAAPESPREMGRLFITDAGRNAIFEIQSFDRLMVGKVLG